MDQIKIGAFLKELRKEKNLTQEQLAEKLHISGRTISRWETGSDMPDISLLVELSGFYQVSIPEIIQGERKSKEMDQETKETAIKMAEYSHNEVKARTKHNNRRLHDRVWNIHHCFGAGDISWRQQLGRYLFDFRRCSIFDRRLLHIK